jgi:hypothetical protein
MVGASGAEVFMVEASRAEGLATGVLLAGGDFGVTDFGGTVLGSVVTSVVITPLLWIWKVLPDRLW